MPFFEELKRRNVFKVGIAYLVGSWILIQIADILFENIGTPEWVMQTMLVFLGIGFFVALFLAWAFEMTPEGVKREADVDRSQSITTHTGKKLNNAILAMMALAIGYLLFDKFSAPREMGSENHLSSANITTEDESGKSENSSLTPIISRQSIAVLPFDNRSRNVDDEYFTEGIHDDLLTNLSRIKSLKVISRTSVNQYKDTEKTIPQIAAELGVATIMEGAVQRSGNTVRINVQLIDAKTDEHLWAEIYDRELTVENLFAIQSEIAERIAHALEATLSPEEEQRINDFPTQSMEAYNAYLRGRQLMPRRTSTDLQTAMEAFELAVELDPQFALAWVAIAETSGLLVSYSTLDPDSALKLRESAVIRALEINPELGEAYASLAGVYGSKLQHDKQEEAYQRAIELSPGYATAYMWYAGMLGNRPDRLGEALDLIQKAEELDPLSSIIQSQRGNILWGMGRLQEAEAQYLKVLALNPGFPPAMRNLSNLYAWELGRIDEAVIWARRAHQSDTGSMAILGWLYFHLIELGADEQAQAVYQQMGDLDPENFWLSIAKAYTNIKDGRFSAAREEASFLSGRVRQPWAQWLTGEVFAMSGDHGRAREFLFRVEPGYLDPGQWDQLLARRQEDACLAGYVLLNTGDEELGQKLLHRTVVYLEETLPRYIDHAHGGSSFWCHVSLGDIDRAFAALEKDFEHKHNLDDWWIISSSPLLRAIHEDPRFVNINQQAQAELARQRENLARIEAETGP